MHLDKDNLCRKATKFVTKNFLLIVLNEMKYQIF